MTPQEKAVLDAARKYAEASRAVRVYADANPSPRYGEIKQAHGELVGQRERALDELKVATVYLVAS